MSSPRLATPITALLALAATSSLACQKKTLTLQQALGAGGARVRYYAEPQRARWAPDGVHYVTRREGETVWVDPATGTAIKPFPHDGDTGEEPRPRGRGSDRASAALATEAAKLTGRDRADLRITTRSPDQAWLSFVAGSDLVVVRVADKTQWAVTDDGDDDLLDGILDWVYQEEVYGRGNFRGHWWSKDSQAVAYLRLDESPVKEFTIVVHVPDGALDVERAVETEVTSYPKAGDPNPTVRLRVAWPAEKKTTEIALDGYDPDILIVRVGWTEDHRLLFMVQDRIQTWLDLNVADPRTGAVTRLLREESDTWVNRLPMPRFLDDGSFLWLSERTGYQHIYHHEKDGSLRRALTDGQWQVRRIVKVGELDGATRVWFTGTRDGAIDDNLYRVDLAGGKIRRLTQGPGRHQTSLNGDGSYFLDLVSAIDTPAEMRVSKGDGNAFEVLGRATPRDAEKYVLCPRERLTLTARDGYQLDATLIRPPEFDPNKRYPIYLPTYSGPDAPSVRNSFSVSAWQQFIAQSGALVLQVNVRSASGRGQTHTGLCYKRLGVVELSDLEDAVAQVCAEHGGDPERVAIDGWSYGGFMAAYALTHSKAFSLGIAGAGVHDWRLYDTIYTERYMSTPQLNEAGYDETSVIKAAKNLHGHLVLQHGGMDDNVHVQNTMQLVHALQRADLDGYELMLYPTSRHGVRSGHRKRMAWRALQKHLRLAEAGGATGQR